MTDPEIERIKRKPQSTWTPEEAAKIAAWQAVYLGGVKWLSLEEMREMYPDPKKSP